MKRTVILFLLLCMVMATPFNTVATLEGDLLDDILRHMGGRFSHYELVSKVELTEKKMAQKTPQQMATLAFEALGIKEYKVLQEKGDGMNSYTYYGKGEGESIAIITLMKDDETTHMMVTLADTGRQDTREERTGKLFEFLSQYDKNPTITTCLYGIKNGTLKHEKVFNQLLKDLPMEEVETPFSSGENHYFDHRGLMDTLLIEDIKANLYIGTHYEDSQDQTHIIIETPMAISQE